MNDDIIMVGISSRTGGRILRASKRLSRAILGEVVHQTMVHARDTGEWHRLAALPAWAKAMIVDLGKRAGVKAGDVRAVVGDD